MALREAAIYLRLEEAAVRKGVGSSMKELSEK